MSAARIGMQKLAGIKTQSARAGTKLNSNVVKVSREKSEANDSGRGKSFEEVKSNKLKSLGGARKIMSTRTAKSRKPKYSHEPARAQGERIIFHMSFDRFHLPLKNPCLEQMSPQQVKQEPLRMLTSLPQSQVKNVK